MNSSIGVDAILIVWALAPARLSDQAKSILRDSQRAGVRQVAPALLAFEVTREQPTPVVSTEHKMYPFRWFASFGGLLCHPTWSERRDLPFLSFSFGLWMVFWPMRFLAGLGRNLRADFVVGVPPWGEWSVATGAMLPFLTNFLSILLAGGFGEHQFVSADYDSRISDYPGSNKTYGARHWRLRRRQRPLATEFSR